MEWWLNEYKEKQVLSVLEFIKRKVMKRMHKRLTEARKWKTDLPPYIHRNVDAATKARRYCRVMYASDIEFEVVQEKSNVYVVDLHRKTCNCGAYQISGVPCHHVLSCISYIGHNPIDYIDDKLKRLAYMATYQEMIKPLPYQSSWPNDENSKIKPLDIT